jgi:hypothetical protein
VVDIVSVLVGAFYMVRLFGRYERTGMILD